MTKPAATMGVAPATPPPQGPIPRSPVGRPEGGPGAGPTTGVDLDYIGTLNAEQRNQLFELAGLLRYVLARQGKRSRDVKAVRGCSKIGALLALNDARRPRLSTLLVLADEIGVPRHVMLDIAEACPAAIAPEGKGNPDD